MSELFNKKLIFIFKNLSRCKTKTQLKTLKIKLITMANVCEKTMCLYDEDIEGLTDHDINIILKMWDEEDNENGDIILHNISNNITEFYKGKKDSVKIIQPKEVIKNKEISNENILLVSLDYDGCSVAITADWDSCWTSRCKMNDFYEKEAKLEGNSVKLAKENSESIKNHIKSQVKDFLEKYPDGKVIGVCGSYRQDYGIDVFNKNRQNQGYSIYDNHFKGVVAKGNENLVCIENGDMEKIFKALDIEFWKIMYADGDGEVGSAMKNKRLTVENNFPRKLLGANDKPIRFKYNMDKKALIASQFAKAENRWPKANINMLFYDDKVEYIKSASKVPRRENWKFTGFHYDCTSICDKKISTPTIVN